MEAALVCAQCGTPATSRRFCTTCGAPSSTDVGADRPLSENVVSPVPTHESLGAAPIPDTAGSPAAPWLVGEPVVAPPRTRPNILALCVAAALMLSGWAIWRGVEEHTLSGTVMLVAPTYSGDRPGSSCTGQNGFGDIAAGAQVVLTDDEGTTLSTGRLSDGEFDGIGCVFSFALEDVTRADFYRLEIAGGSRGQLQYSYNELAGAAWSLQLSLGDD